MLGLYPTWFEPGVGSGWIIGFIATIHVLFSHASVGGGILFAWLANYAVRKDRPVYLSFIRRYGLFLLIFSYVLGSITGPGIWFAATVASPRGISALIHSFVWLWASEWVFFLIEVVGVYLLVYLAGRVDPKTHTRIATIFGLSSVATLLVIAGILSFMLWPGQADWHQTGGVLNAFFGENTFAQVPRASCSCSPSPASSAAWWPGASAMRTTAGRSCAFFQLPASSARSSAV